MRPRALGYCLVQGAYHPLIANQHSWPWLESVKLWIGLQDNWLVCFDEKGNAIGDYVEVNEGREIAEVRAEQAQREAEKAESRALSEMQARLELETRLQSAEEELYRLRSERR